MRMEELPENVRRCMPKDEREGFGKAAMTSAEGEAKFKERNERAFQRQISDYLRMKGVNFVFNARMDCKTSNPVGTPDFLFCFRGCFIAIEAKQPGTYPTKEQADVLKAIEKDGGRVSVVRTLHEVVELLRDIESTHPTV